MSVPRKAQDEGKPAGHVPAVDLGATFTDLRQELGAAVERVLASGRYIGGPEVERLESEFAAFCGVPHAGAVASGTDALRFALLAAELGGSTVFVDVDPESLTLDPDLVKKAITDRTGAILPVHLYGQTADMGPILEMARARGLAVVEDACQAHGTLYRGSATAG